MLRLTEAECGVTVTDKLIYIMPKHNHMLYEGSVWC